MAAITKMTINIGAETDVRTRVFDTSAEAEKFCVNMINEAYIAGFEMSITMFDTETKQRSEWLM